MLALYLQFSRLDDVIHFPLKAPTLTHPFWGMEEKSVEFVQILWARGRPGHPTVANPALELSISGQADITTPLGCGVACSIYNLVRAFD
jgi:hypothetical protein